MHNPFQLLLLLFLGLVAIPACSGYQHAGTQGLPRSALGRTQHRKTLLAGDGGRGESSSSSSSGGGNLFFERIESIKFVVVGVLSGSVASLPPAIILGALNGFDAQWEVSHDLLAASLAVYALIYRYAFREGDSNEMQKMGVVGGLAAMRALAAVQVSQDCSPFPISCSLAGWLQLAVAPAEVFVESFVVFTASSLAFEAMADKGLLKRFRGL